MRKYSWSLLWGTPPDPLLMCNTRFKKKYLKIDENLSQAQHNMDVVNSSVETVSITLLVRYEESYKWMFKIQISEFLAGARS